MSTVEVRLMLLELPDFLAQPEVADIASHFDSAVFEDGRQTAAGTARRVKANKQIARHWPGLQHFEAVINRALTRSRLLAERLSPAACSATIFAEYHSGDCYGPHIDAVFAGQPPIRHDLSVTLFLNEPDDYNGGELRLHLPGGEFQDIKLRSGSAIAYPTTLVHEVLPIRSGIRRVAVFWIQSFYRDSEIRQIVADLRITLNHLRSQSEVDSLPLACALANLERKFIGS